MVSQIRTFALNVSAAVDDGRLRDILRVSLSNGGTIVFVHLVELKLLAELGLILLSAAYTIWRWRKDIQKGDK